MNLARAVAMGATLASGCFALLPGGCSQDPDGPVTWVPPRSTVEPVFGDVGGAASPTDAGAEVDIAEVVDAGVLDANFDGIGPAEVIASDSHVSKDAAPADAIDAAGQQDVGQGDAPPVDTGPVGCPADCPGGPNCKAQAQPEACNGKDDDCDGQTDNNVCDDGNPCNLDACDPTSGCAHVSVPDGKACGANSTCSGGVCKPVGGLPVSPTPGSLVITELMANPASVSDSLGEWFEIHNPGPSPVQLGALVLADVAGTFTVSDNNLTIQSGGWLVFGRELDISKNGGVPVTKAYSKVTLNNASGDTLRIQLADGTVIDQVIYTPGANGWSKLGNGVSYQLDPTKLSASANDLGGSWCLGKTTFGAGDLGSPGQLNGSCP